jgi:formylmethanofuran dehydrogenase subunit E
MCCDRWAAKEKGKFFVNACIVGAQQVNIDGTKAEIDGTTETILREKAIGSELMKCDICGEKGGSFLSINHKVHGSIKICYKCFEKERLNLLPQKGGCSCCR